MDRQSITWAPLSNIALAASTIQRLENRSSGLPGIGALYGPSGFGKTMAAAYCANKFNAVYIECRSYFTKRAFIESLAKEIDVPTGRTIAKTFEAVIDEQLLARRTIIVDEADYIVESKILELLRDLHEAAQCAILLIGEEQLPHKLKKSERFHNRVLMWQPAAAATKEDTLLLAKFYCPGLSIADDLLDAIRERSRSVARRICVNLDMVRAVASQQGLTSIDLPSWDSKNFYTGEAPTRRAA